MPELSRLRQTGISLVETALLLPVILTIVFLAADLFRINLVRGQLEQAVDSLSSVLAGQQQIGRSGFDALVEATMAAFPDYQLNIAQVQSNHRIDWWLVRGDATSLCDERFTVKSYNGELPLTSSNDVLFPLVVIQGCIPASHLGYAGRLLMKQQLQTVSVARQMMDGVQLDDELTQEAGLDNDDE